MRRAVSVAAVVATVVLIGGWLAVYSGLLGGPTPSPALSQGPPSSPSSASRPPIASQTPSTPSPIATPIDTNIHANAVVVPIRSADLAMSISGVVSTVYVHPNDQVIGGALLLKLDQTKYLSDIQVASAAVDQAQAAVDNATLAVEQLPADATTDQVNAAQAALRLANANLELAHQQSSAAQAALRQTELRSPIAGTVASIDVTTGEQVNAGQTIASVGDFTTWLVETTDVSELDVVRVAVGDRATITFTALPGVEETGVVDSIEPRGTDNNGEINFAVTIQPDTYLPQLRWNMSATVSIVPTS
ncbi:MAG TPA: efflux RND transporter periplasmic adaptor subunit [Candidatus Limnocylindrales bacterium]